MHKWRETNKMPTVTVEFVDYLRPGKRDQASAENTWWSETYNVEAGNDSQIGRNWGGLAPPQSEISLRSELFWWVKNGDTEFITVNSPKFQVGSGDVFAKLYWVENARMEDLPEGTYLDTFDLKTGRFLRGSFCDVEYRPDLTALANRKGRVRGRQLVVARAELDHPGTAARFREWFMALPPATMAGDQLRTWGVMRAFVFAVYGDPKPRLDALTADEALTVLKVIGGILQGGGGVIVKPGGGADPIDPLGPLLERLEPATKQALMAVLVDAVARAMGDGRLKPRLASAALGQLRAALRR